MNTSEIVSALDSEISRLQQIRALVAGPEEPQKRRGRPKGSTNKKSADSKPASTTAHIAASGKRTMSPEGRARIAAAQRARWARQGASGTAAKKGSRTASKGAAKTIAAKFAGSSKAAKRTAKSAPAKQASENASSTGE